MSDKHVSKMIARSSSCRIDQCSCGAVHISVGGTTVRMREGVARELRDILTLAMQQIDTHSTMPAPTPRFHLVPSLGGGSGDDDPELH